MTQSQPQPDGDASDALFDGETPKDGIALLVQLTKTGQVDPWNIDIAKVADEYLKAVSAMGENDLFKVDLKNTGKTLLYLAVLLRMKSDQLAGINYLDPPEENELLDEGFDPDYVDDETLQKRFNFASLDELIQRRNSTKEKRIRPVTLQDLIAELKRYEELENHRVIKDKIVKTSERRMRDYSDFTADDIEDMAHEEFIEDTIFNLSKILERIFVYQERVSLTELQEQGGLDKISSFLALLFLAARSEVDLVQDGFYQELYVSRDVPPLQTFEEAEAS